MVGSLPRHLPNLILLLILILFLIFILLVMWSDWDQD